MKPTDKRAFSLVELIVVIGILGVLLAFTFPALRSIRTAQKQTVCMSNLRQFLNASQRYANVHDAWPAALLLDVREGSTVQLGWDYVRAGAGDSVIEVGSLWAFSDAPDEILECPGYEDAQEYNSDAGFTGYNYNASFVGAEKRIWNDWDNYQWVPQYDSRGTRPGTASRPDATAMFGCGGYRDGPNRFMRAPENPEGFSGLSITYAGTQAFHYDGTTNVAYLDGHVSAVSGPREGQESNPELLDLMGWPENGFLSHTNDAYDPR